MRGHPTARPGRRAAPLAALAATALVSVAAASPALAHNVLIGSSPEEGETLDTVPEEVVLTFNEEVLEGGNAIAVTGPDGEDHTTGDVRIDDAEAATDLGPLPEPGDYEIAYRIVSADGHVIEGELAFTAAEEAVAAPEEEGAEDDHGGGETAEEESEPAADDAAPVAQQEETGLFGLDTLLGLLVALGVIGAMVVIIIRLRKQGPGGDGEQ